MRRLQPYLALMLIVSACNVRWPIKYLVPDGCRGWLIVRYEVEGAQPLEVRGGTVVIRFPDSGIIETSSAVNGGIGIVEYWYYSPHGERKRIPLESIWGMRTGRRGKLKMLRIFIGTHDEFRAAADPFFARDSGLHSDAECIRPGEFVKRV